MDTLLAVFFLTLLLYKGTVFAEQAEPPFGSAGNPVKSQGVSGAREYIENLDCNNSAIPEYKHETTTEVGPSGTRLEKYALRCEADDVQMFTIYLDPGHDQTETRPVKGFTSWL